MAIVAVAASGGIDSLCAALLIKKAGHDVIALHGLFSTPADAPAELKVQCAAMAIPLVSVDLRSEFKRAVIAGFESGRKAGLTPNPCASCNREIKFGALAEAARKLGADLFATGHYANLARLADGNLAIAPAADSAKDQGYFLGLVPAHALENVLFPLAGQLKSETRAMIAQAGLPAVKGGESQDICFQPEASAGHCGPVLLCEDILPDGSFGQLRQIGEHSGLAGFTIGQRKGLRIPWSAPLHVLAKDGERNALLVMGRPPAMRGCEIDSLNFFAPYASWPRQLYARMRYRQEPCGVTASLTDNGVSLRLHKPAFPTAPGQLAAIYDANGLMLAGGIVRSITCC
ncbi:MAG: tRNA-specific 2-thiouridylase [Desulfovibrio sp.]|nr:tRNA-specific 2-thiouridylase [Desulfovibrio sp.]